MHYMKTEQLTLRVDRVIAAALRRRARERRIPKSQVVREALAAYLVGDAGPEDAAGAWERVSAMAGSLRLDHATAGSDPIAQRLRAHNWRA